MRVTRRTPPAAEAEQGRPREPGELPSLAIITMARDEGQMVKRWVDYYTPHVGVEHLIIIDDNSSDGSTDDLDCPVLRIPYLRKRGFEPSRMGLLAGISAGLLEAYDAVMFADADEFVVPEPTRYPTLRHFVADRPGRDAIGVLGFNVVHDPAEPALLADQPILGQRQLAKFVPLMCKPSLKWQPAAWAHASHGIECPYEIDKDLYMFHMKFADRDHLADVAAKRHHLNATEGRAKKTSWERSGDEMVGVLDEITAGLDASTVPEFEAKGLGLKKIVVHRGSMWRATGDAQVPAMRKLPFVRIPDRFHGLL